MTEAVGNSYAPVPVVLAVRLGVAGNEQSRGLDVARLVENAQVEIEVCPVVRQSVYYLSEVVLKRHISTG